jgi:arylsulfatase
MRRLTSHLLLLLACSTLASLGAPGNSRHRTSSSFFATILGMPTWVVTGRKGCQTPNIDRLAHEGRRFTDFYVAQAVCSASRAALLTGCYPIRVGILGALGPRSKVGLSSNEVTIAEIYTKSRLCHRHLRQMALGRRSIVSAHAPWFRRLFRPALLQ